jgi:hypothetical protein
VITATLPALRLSPVPSAELCTTTPPSAGSDPSAAAMAAPEAVERLLAGQDHSQTGAALRENENDIVNAIMSLSM